MEKYLLVLLGGAAGSLARYLTGTFVAARVPGAFPLGTLAVNAIGCFLIGTIMPALSQKGISPHWRLLLVTGFLGGFTTFSAFAFETYALVRGGSPWIGLANVILSVTIGYLAVWAGARLIG